MVESIKEIYTNVESLVFSTLNNYIGGKFQENMLKTIEYTLILKIQQFYPFLNVKLNLVFNNYSHCLKTDIKVNSNSFPLMSYNNWKTHDFIEITEFDLNNYNFQSYYGIEALRCQNCNIKISESGSPIDGDYSCDEWIIKNIIE